MKLTTKIVSAGAALLLVAGAGAMASAPATAADSIGKLDTKKSATIISFKKDLLKKLVKQGVTIKAVAPATWNPAKAQVRFPVTKVTTTGISHSGGITFSKGGVETTVTDPVITGADVNVTSSLGPIPLMTLKNTRPKETCKVDGSHSKWIKKTTATTQANVHLTSNALVVSVLQGLSPLFTADLGLGEGRVTLIYSKDSSKKPAC